MKSDNIRLIFGFIFIAVSIILLAIGPDYSAILFAAVAMILFLINIILDWRNKK